MLTMSQGRVLQPQYNKHFEQENPLLGCWGQRDPVFGIVECLITSLANAKLHSDFQQCLPSYENEKCLQTLLDAKSLQWRLVAIVIVLSLSHVRFFGILWTVACQAPLSFTIFQSLLRFMSIEPVMPSNHFILCCPLLLLSSIFPNIRVFSNESALLIKWLKYWSFSFSISPSIEYSGLISFRID